MSDRQLREGFDFERIREGKYRFRLLRDQVEKVQVDGVAAAMVDTPYISLRGYTLIALAGYAWDGASGGLAINTRNSIRGSLNHDELYQLIRDGHLAKGNRKAADRVLRRILREDGMSAFRAWLWYRSVRAVGWTAVRPRK